MRYCGRGFSSAEIHCILQIIEAHPTATRARLSRLVCEQLDWRRDDGRLKDMSCRVAMLRMQDDRLLHLPPPRNGNNNGKPYLRRTLWAEPAAPLEAASPKQLGELHLEVVTGRHDAHLHNEFIDRYHYLGYQPLPGAQLRTSSGPINASSPSSASAPPPGKPSPATSSSAGLPSSDNSASTWSPTTPVSSFSPGCVARTSRPPSWGWPHEGSHRTGTCTMATAPYCSKPSSSSPGSVEPATARQTGASWARPRAGESSTSTTRHCCRRRPSGSIHSSRTSGVFSAPDESPFRCAL